MKNVENVCNVNFPEKMKNVKIQPNLPDCPPPPISTSLFMNSAEVTRESSFPTKNKNISSRDEVVNVLKRKQRSIRNEMYRNIFKIYLLEMIS